MLQRLFLAAAGLAAALVLALPSTASAANWDPCTITGTDGNDVIYGTDGPDVICGLKGDDLIYGLGGDDQILGGAGNDTLYGGDGSDRISGQTGNNVIYGEASDPNTMQRLSGGPGNDLIVGGPGSDDLTGSGGNDTLWGGDGNDYVDYSCRTDDVHATLGGTANSVTPGDVEILHDDIENIIGGAGNDVLIGDGADNYLNGGPGGNDTLEGMGGNDRLMGGYWEKSSTNCAKTLFNPLGDADVYMGGDGVDQVTYGTRTDPVRLSIGDGANDGDAAIGEHDDIQSDVEQVFGSKGNDVIVGDNNANYLDGGPGGNDTLIGMGGVDSLYPGVGNDTVDGGDGADRVYAAGDNGFVDTVDCDLTDVLHVDRVDQLSGGCVDVLPPTAPSGLQAGSVSRTGLQLSWVAATDDFGVTSYTVSRNGTPMATVHGTSAWATGLSCGTTYSFSVTASDAAGNVSAPATLSVATQRCPDTTPPTVSVTSQSLTGTGVGATLALGAAVADDFGVRRVEVDVDGTSVATQRFDTAQLSANVSFTLTAKQLRPGATRAIQVVAYDDKGNAGTASFNVAVPADTTEPTTPLGLVTTGVWKTAVRLAWQASSDANGVKEYDVTQDGAAVAAQRGTNLYVSGLTCGTTYTFAVRAVDPDGNASAPATLAVTTANC